MAATYVYEDNLCMLFNLKKVFSQFIFCVIINLVVLRYFSGINSVNSVVYEVIIPRILYHCKNKRKCVNIGEVEPVSSTKCWESDFLLM